MRLKAELPFFLSQSKVSCNVPSARLDVISRRYQCKYLESVKLRNLSEKFLFSDKMDFVLLED